MPGWAYREAIPLRRWIPLLVLLSACDVVPAEEHRVAPGATAAIAPVEFSVPAEDEIPAGPAGASIRRGRAIVTATPESLPTLVRSSLRCTSCHLDGGTRQGVMPWVGVAARFPQYRSRSGAVISLEERIAGCFVRSLNAARAPGHGSPEMTDIVAYLTWLSRGTPIGRETEGQGMPRLEPLVPDTVRGRLEYAAQCARCHGVDGQGGPGGGGIPPATPLWGHRSYNVGAGMARVRMAADFIHAAMPFDQPGSLSPQQAYDIAAYMNSHGRPDFAGKENDWPNGDPPADVAYETRAARRTPR